LLSASFKRKLHLIRRVFKFRIGGFVTQPKRLHHRAIMTMDARAHPQYLEFTEARKKG
jgi:hypothetical protein